MTILINKQINPYIIGRPIHKPEHFFGRNEIFAFIQDNLSQRTKVILLHGQRRIGKSSVLSQIPNFVKLDNFVFVILSLEGKSKKSLHDVLYELAREIKSYLEDELEFSVQSIEVAKREAFQEDRDVFTRDFLPQVYEVLGNKNLVLLFDEFDVLEDGAKDAAIDHFFPYLRSIIDKQDHLYIIPVVGRRLDDIPNLLQLFFHQASNQKIGLLRRENTEKLILKPVRGILEYKEEAVNAILELTSGHPYFTQVVCFALFSRAREEEKTKITREDVENIVERAIELGEGGLTWFRDSLPIPERIVLLVIAKIQEIENLENKKLQKDQFLSFVLYYSGFENIKKLENTIKNLVDWDFCRLNLSSYKISIELVRLWLVNSFFIDQEIEVLKKNYIQENLAEDRLQLQQLLQSYQKLSPDVAVKQETELRRDLRDWFTTLGYRFEGYEAIEKEYFEWIINIPARRGYDRILVRWVDGEAGINDINEVREVVATNKTDEGWIVAPRRVSRAARNEVKKEENCSIFCYTFDELLDDVADFSGYFAWLENEVKSRQVDATYVSLACTKEEVDPDTHQRIGVSHYEEQDGWIDGYIDMWLDDPTKEHISILGEFGTGKTWFALHYAWTALTQYLEAKKRGIERPRLPLVIPLRDYAKAVTVESLFSEFFFRKHEIGLPGYSAFEKLNRMGKLLLIFDGFDQMTTRVDRQAMMNNFWELAKVVVPGAKVILTCRTEHFPEAKEGRRLLNAELKASTSNLTGEPPQFEVLELEKFTNEQIRQVLSFQTEAKTVEKVMGNEQLLDLARRPGMIELILEALPEIEAGKAIDIARIYLYAIRRKMERDIKTERTFTSLEDKLYFLCELSWEMLLTDKRSLNYRDFPDRIRRYFGAEVQEQKDLDHWHYDMMGQTMLVRNAEGDYYPAYRSLLEFFVAFKFAAELGFLAADFAEIGDLSRFEMRSDLRESFGKMPLTKSVIDLMLPMLESGEEIKKKLLEIVRSARGKTEEEVGYLKENAMILLKYMRSHH